MRCPYCQSEKVKIVAPKQVLFVTLVRESEDVGYDEKIVHFQCENSHAFYGPVQEEADMRAELMKVEKL
jgi:hypothetical protein